MDMPVKSRQSTEPPVRRGPLGADYTPANVNYRLKDGRRVRTYRAKAHALADSSTWTAYGYPVYRPDSYKGYSFYKPDWVDLSTDTPHSFASPAASSNRHGGGTIRPAGNADHRVAIACIAHTGEDDPVPPSAPNPPTEKPPSFGDSTSQPKALDAQQALRVSTSHHPHLPAFALPSTLRASDPTIPNQAEQTPDEAPAPEQANNSSASQVASALAVPPIPASPASAVASHPQFPASCPVPAPPTAVDAGVDAQAGEHHHSLLPSPAHDEVHIPSLASAVGNNADASASDASDRNPSSTDTDHRPGDNVPGSPSTSEEEACVLISDTTRATNLLPFSWPRREGRRRIDRAPHPATGMGTAFHDLLPTALYARIGDDDQERLALLDSCSTIGIVDADLATRLGASPTGPCVPINGIGSDTTLGHVTLPFSIAANAGQEAVEIASSADFHVARGFAPGICFGIDVIKSLGIVIDSARGVASTDKGTFPVFGTKGVRHTAAQTAKTVRACEVKILPPESHSWVRVTHGCKPGVSYTMNSALWSHWPARTLFATAAALVDVDTSAVLVTNFSRRPHRIPANFVLGEAVPLVVGLQGVLWEKHGRAAY
ncbi:uncharacterized protein PSFLO_04572 [Pseudozyma flocculosa]|uniref:Uncharacterized protein n=1 Tax=Pseudozyma flocculosa TaxID=84751 RepID=A0A5C3F3L1_9BASI|nr:uncharacterized protein PSFLO_04572 [Pseudozyma flocculosa]